MSTFVKLKVVKVEKHMSEGNYKQGYMFIRDIPRITNIIYSNYMTNTQNNNVFTNTNTIIHD